MNTSKALIADIGGTNARFALIGNHNNYLYTDKLIVADYPNLEAAIHSFLVSSGYRQPQTFAIAVACPVDSEDIQLTNSHWSFNKQHVQSKFGLDKFIVMNDFSALAHAVPTLDSTDLELMSGDAESVGNKAVLGAGTGLGVSGIVYNKFSAKKRGYHVIEGEGGHVSCAVNSAIEQEIMACIHKKIPRISAERVLSGAGVELIYQALCEINDKQAHYSVQHITQLALDASCDDCVEALNIYCAMFGSFAGDLALTLGAKGGVYIGGGVILKFKDFFVRSQFRRSFENKGRFADYLRDIPVYLITNEIPAFNGIIEVLDIDAK